MAAKHLDIKQRKDRILAIVVGQYIKTITPVGSHTITEEFNLDVSPATVRNILAELEEQGYLTHPHTSAGRIPTQRGYRYYVDHLMNEIELLEGEKKRIQAECKQYVNQLENLMDKASSMISDITSYTTIISVDGWGSKIILKGTKEKPVNIYFTHSDDALQQIFTIEEQNNDDYHFNLSFGYPDEILNFNFPIHE